MKQRQQASPNWARPGARTGLMSLPPPQPDQQLPTNFGGDKFAPERSYAK